MYGDTTGPFDHPNPDAMKQPQESGGMEDGEYCIPLKALQQPDNEEEMQTPAEGDNVQFNVEATVTRIEGENAYVKPISINGEPVANEDKGEQDENNSPDQQEGDELRQMAQGMQS